MIKGKFAAVVTAAITAASIGSAQARPLPQEMTGVAISTSQIKSNAPLPAINPFRVANAATIQLAAGRARVLSEPTPPPFVPPTYPPAPTFKLPTSEPTQFNLAPPGSFPGRVSRRAFAPPAK
jgi:hypothetical protein